MHLVASLQENKSWKMTDFGSFFRAAIFNLVVPLLPTFPAREKSIKEMIKYF